MPRRLFRTILFCLAMTFTSCQGIQPQIKDTIPQKVQNLQEASHAFLRLRGSIGSLDILYGSGFVIHSNNTGSYVITSDHICDFESNTLKGRKFPSRLEPFMILWAETLQGDLYPMKAQFRDKKHDICLLKIDKANLPSLELGKAPEVAKKYTTISSPGGLAGKNRILIYDGYFSGEIKLETLVSYDMYTLPATQGSSGSPILDENFYVVGVISRVSPLAPDVLVSSPHQSLLKIVDQLNSILDAPEE